MNLLLIDTRINDVDKIVDSLLKNVDYILFSYETDTYDLLKEKIINLGIETKYEYIGIAQINYGATVFDFLQNHGDSTINIVKNVEIEDPNLNTWSAFIDFCEWLINEKGCKTVDLLACNIWSDPDWVYVIETMRERGIYIRASVDITGSGGNFILESDGVDMIGIYFTDAVLAYKYSFDYNPSWNSVRYNSSILNSYNGTYLYSIYSELYNDIPGNAYNDSEIKTDILNITSYSIISDNVGNQTNVFLKKDGTIITSGSYVYGGNSSRDDILSPFLINIRKIIPCGIGFLVIKTNGDSIFVYGQDITTPNATGIQINGYNIIDGINNKDAICAITNQNSGIFITNTTTVNLQSIIGTGILKYVAGLDYFCFIKSDNTAIIYTNSGTNYAVTGVSVKEIYATYSSTNVLFLLSNNTIVNSAKTVLYSLNLNVNIKKFVPFYNNNYCFLYSDGSGTININGTSTNYTGLNDFAANSLAYIYLQNGNVSIGGTTGNFILPTTQTISDNMVVKLYATSNAGFIALKQNKSIVFWGTDFTSMSGITPTLHPYMTQDVEDVICGYNNFICKRKNDIISFTNKMLGYGNFTGATSSTFNVTNDSISSNRNGIYIISASSTNGTNYPYNVMNTGSSLWQSNASYYAGGINGGMYNGTSYTTIQNIGNVSGEWIQIQLPSQIILVNYTIKYTSAFPRQFYVVGSTNGTNWYKIDYNRYECNSATSITLSFTVKNTILYNYYRFIFIELPYSVPIYNKQSRVSINQILLFSSFNINGGYNILKSYYTPNNSYNDISLYNYPLIINYLKYESLTPSSIQSNFLTNIVYTSNNISYYSESYHIYGLYANSTLLSTYYTNLNTYTYTFNNVLLNTYASSIAIFDITNYTYSNGIKYKIFDLSINIQLVPDHPIITNAIQSNKSIIVYFTQSTNISSIVYPITSYKYKLNEGSLLDCIGTTSPITISNLTNGTSYTIQLYSVNQIGISTKNDMTYINNGNFDKSRTTTPYTLSSNDTLYDWYFNTDATLSGSSTMQIIGYDLILPSIRQNCAILTISHNGGGYTETEITQWVNFTNLNKKVLTFYLKFNGLTAGYSDYKFVSLYNNNILNNITNTTAYPYTLYSITFIPTSLNGYIKFYFYGNRPGPFGANQTINTYITGINLTDYIDINKNKNIIPYTNPSAPIINSITSGDLNLTLNITQPDTGGFAITKYSYSLDAGTSYIDFSELSLLKIVGLTNGVMYNVAIKANNGILDSPISNTIQAIPYTNPDAPLIDSIIPGNQQLTVYFSKPTNNGGISIQTYKYSLDNGISFTDSISINSPFVISGLTNGITYSVILRSNNTIDSLNSNMVLGTPYTNPFPPIITSITESNATLSINFIPPSNTGGKPIQKYKYSINGGITFTDTATLISPIIITGLINGTSYPIVLRADNSLESTNSNTIIGIPYSPPDSPIITSISSSYKQLTINFTPGASNGGLPVTSYFYSLDRGITYTRLPELNTTFSITGLINGQTYEVILIANNYPQVVSSLAEKPANNSLESNIYSAIPAATPDAPTILHIESRENGILYIHFSLGDSNGSPVYKLQYTTDGWKTYQTINSVQSPFVVSKLQIGISYPFQIKSYNNLGLSPTSSIIYGMPVSSITKNTTLNTKRAMPPKDQTSDGSAEFSQYRRLYEKTVDNLLNGDPTKKWTSEQPIASTLTFNRKIVAIGEGSLNAEGEAISFMDESPTTPEEALRRLRRKK